MDSKNKIIADPAKVALLKSRGGNVLRLNHHNVITRLYIITTIFKQMSKARLALLSSQKHLKCFKLINCGILT